MAVHVEQLDHGIGGGLHVLEQLAQHGDDLLGVEAVDAFFGRDVLIGIELFDPLGDDIPDVHLGLGDGAQLDSAGGDSHLVDL